MDENDLLSFIGLPSKTSAGTNFFLIEVHLSQRLPKPTANGKQHDVYADDGKGPYATLFCRNAIGNTVSLIVCGWKPWVRLMSLDPDTKPHKMFAFGKLLSKIDGETKEERLKKLYGWIAAPDMSTQEFHCLKIYLNSLHGADKLADDIKDEPRLVMGDVLQPQKTRFLNDTGLCPCSWFIAKNINWLSDSDARWTNSQYEGIVHFTDVESKESEDVPPLLVASFDCEMSSDDNLFPSVYKGDTTFCISTAFGIVGKPIKKISLFLGNGTNTESDTHRILYFSTFADLFESWQNILILTDPDFVTGWNTEGFDFDFLYQQYSLFFVDPLLRLNDVMAQHVIKNLVSLEDLAKAAPKYLKKKILFDLFQKSSPPTQQLKHLLTDEVCGFGFEEDDDDEIIGYGLSPEKHWELRKLLGDTTKYTIDPELVSKLPKHQQTYISTPKRNGPRKGLYLSRFRTIDSDIKLQALSTSAKGDNFLIRIPMIGRVVFDMMRIIKEDQKPPSNALRYAAETWLQDKGKLDMPYEELFRIYNQQDTEKYAEVIEYCARDAEIPLLLLFKLQYIVSWLNLCRVCYLSPDNIVNGGQQQRVFSLISRRVLHTHVINTEPSGWPASPDYVGATVMDPIPNFYDKPLSTLDFASLYPSIEASNNLCFSTLVTDRKQLSKLKDSENRKLYQDFAIDHPLPDGTTETRHYAFVTHVKSVLADLLIHLLSSRKAVKKQMEAADDLFLKDIYNKRQAALKVVCNSVYGFTGTNVDKGMLSCKPVAAATTLIGRKLIGLTKAYVEDEFKPARVVYGDSVSPNTTLLIRENNLVQLKRIDEIVSEWQPWHDDKEMAIIKADTWSDTGFTPIVRIIRHKLHPDKKMFRILTHTGIVDCTEDHSLLLPNKQEISPKDIKVGSELLHHDINLAFTHCDEELISEKEAWAWGLFMADGSSDVYDCPSGQKATWAINKANLELLNKAKDCLPFETKILDTMESSGVYKLVCHCANTKLHAAKYRELFYNQAREKIVPHSILRAPIHIVKQFWDGFYAGDGDHCGTTRITQRGKQSTAGLFILARRLGYSVSVSERRDKFNIFKITCTKNTQRKNPIAIKTLYELNNDERSDYVYDLETASHHFSVLPGNLVVHNTDSVMILWGTQSLNEAYYLGEKAATKVTQYLRSIMKQEQISVVGKEQRDIDAMTSIVKLEHEKEYWPYVLFKKKNYAGRKWTPKTIEPLLLKNELDIKGIQAVRRDTVPWIAELSNDILDILLRIPDGTKPQTQTAMDLVKSRLCDLVENKIELDKFITSKSLAANYASMAIPHVSAWQRMIQRSETNIPSIGSRMPFVFVASKDRKASLSSKAEHPEYVKKSGKKLDIKYYIKAAQNPIMKLLQFADDNTLEDIFKSAMSMDENKNTTSLDTFIGTESSKKTHTLSLIPSPPKKKLKKTVAETTLDAFF